MWLFIKKFSWYFSSAWNDLSLHCLIVTNLSHIFPLMKIKRDKISKLVVLPLYPQFSISTSGSSLRLLESIFRYETHEYGLWIQKILWHWFEEQTHWCIREDEYLVNMQHTVIPSWYQREGYIKAMSDLIEKELKSFDNPEKVPDTSCGYAWLSVIASFLFKTICTKVFF